MADDNPEMVFPAITEKPELIFTDEYYLTAFFKLSSSRQNGMGIGAIPLSEIIRYCEFLEDTEPETFIEIIQHCDNVYMELEAEKMRKDTKK